MHSCCQIHPRTHRISHTHTRLFLTSAKFSFVTSTHHTVAYMSHTHTPSPCNVSSHKCFCSFPFQNFRVSTSDLCHWAISSTSHQHHTLHQPLRSALCTLHANPEHVCSNIIIASDTSSTSASVASGTTSCTSTYPMACICHVSDVDSVIGSLREGPNGTCFISTTSINHHCP